MKILELCELRK